jgi:stage II sporulation protein GA (sporulation sigma-E factor processing peptidase)
MGAMIGALSIFLLFLHLNSFTLFLFKIGISILMILISFSYQNFRYTARNFVYLYMVSIVLGGFLYFLNCEFSYKQEGIFFYHNGLSINAIVLIMISPIVLYTYIKEAKGLKQNYNFLYEMEITLKNKKTISMTAFLDTGNRLTDPYSNRPIIIADESKIKIDGNYILVPFRTVIKEDYLKCYEIEKLIIKGIGEVKNILIGISPNPIHMEGVDCIIGTKLLEG